MLVHIPSLPPRILPTSFRDSLTHKCPQSLRLPVVSSQLKSTWSSQRCWWDVTTTLSSVWLPRAEPEMRCVHTQL